MLLASLLSRRFNPSSRWRSVGIYLLLFYLLFFSTFALYHVYIANELDDAHGCDIGQWIHLSQQAAIVFLLLFSVSLLPDRPSKRNEDCFRRTLPWKDHLKRGPPLNFFPV